MASRLKGFDVAAAFELYLTKCSIDNNDIKKLFQVTSNTTAKRLKKPVISAMADKGISLPFNRIETHTAFEVWGIDIGEIEKKYSKLKKYGLLKSEV